MGKKLTTNQKIRISNLRHSLGELIEFKYRGRVKKFWLAAVTLSTVTYKADKFSDTEYQGHEFQFRLNYEDYETNTKRDWDGFWTNKIDNLLIPTTNAE